MQRGEPLSSEDLISHESLVDLSCEDGFTVQGATAVTCWYGFLTNQVPECVPGEYIRDADCWPVFPSLMISFVTGPCLTC